MSRSPSSARAHAKGYVKNKVMEFVGPGVANLPIEYRNGIDVMTTETTCWSSIWVTDQNTKDYLTIHHRPEAYKELKPGRGRRSATAVFMSIFPRLNVPSPCRCTRAIPIPSPS